MLRFTQADISGAISRVLAVPPSHEAIGRLAGQLEYSINRRPDIRQSGLEGAGFQSLVLSNLTQDVADLMNPAKLQELQRQQAERVNVTSSDAAALAKLGLVSMLGKGENGVGMRGDNSSARFDGINVSALTPFQVQTRNYAIQQGVLWAADNPEILKLGQPAIDMLKQSQLRKDVFEKLTKDAGLSTKGAIGIADIIHKNGGDANTGGEKVAKSLTEINDKNYSKAVDDLGKLQHKPNATEEEKEVARENVRKTGAEAAKVNPKKAQAIEQTNELLGAKKRENAAEAKATAEDTKAATAKKETTANARKGAQNRMDAF